MTKEEDRFQKTPELGQRLRDLRLRAGLALLVLEAIKSDVFNFSAPVRP